MWAGFAVAFVSLATFGQSLNKAAMRMLGTFIASIVALGLLAAFAQDRWMFILALSAYTGVCTYMMGGPRHQYFWHVCGFVCIIITLEAGNSPADAFMTALRRAEETGLGIAVYSLIATFLWPANARAEFQTAASRLAASQHARYRHYRDTMFGADSDINTQSLRSEIIQCHSRFDVLLNAAESDSYEVWELRLLWRQYRDRMLELTETLDRWHESVADIPELDPGSLITGLEAFDSEIEQRFTAMASMLEGTEATRHIPVKIILQFDNRNNRQISHFEKAALAVILQRLQDLEDCSLSLVNCLIQINADTELPATPESAGYIQSFRFVPDLDRLASAARIEATLWIAFGCMIYIGDIPGGNSFVVVTGAIGMVMATAPQLSVVALFVPVATSVLFASILYIFLMPELSGYGELGLMVFLVTFLICYLFSSPRQALSRSFGLAVFASIASISNEQSYSFLVVANTALMWPLAFIVIGVTSFIPISTRAEPSFLRLLARYFRSCQYVMSTMRWNSAQKPSRLHQYKKQFSMREICTIPRKLESWASIIEKSHSPVASTHGLIDLAYCLQSLSFRMEELVEARDKPQATVLVEAMLEDIRNWRLAVEHTFQHLVKDGNHCQQQDLRDKLERIVAELESRTRQVMDTEQGLVLSIEENKNFYRLLGAYRGVSEALVTYTGNASRIDWARLKTYETW